MRTKVIEDATDVLRAEGRYTVAHCPKCDHNYTSIVRVGSLVPTAENADHGTDPIPGTAAIGRTPRRQSALAVEMRCEECDHTFAVVVQQHKGENFVEVHTPFRVSVN